MKGARVLLLPQDAEATSVYALGQKMFTSSDIKQADPPLDDRPYAGWLYAEVGLVGTHGDRLQAWRLGVGIVGPGSLAEETQRLVHDVVGTTEPQGWGTQLPTEPTLLLSYETRWRRSVWQGDNTGLEADLIPSLGVVAGNAYTFAEVGTTIRFGSRLPRDWGGYSPEPAASGAAVFSADGFGWHLFAGFEGRAFARNLFLDGSSFRDSRSVEKEPFVADLQLGAAVHWRKLRLSYTHVIRS
jgi:hypothetical protein